MRITFLYCIDFPKKSDNIDKLDQVRGWLICSESIINIKISDSCNRNYILNYGSPRPDVIEYFKELSDNKLCGFEVIAQLEPINLKDEFLLDIEVELQNKKSKKLQIALDLGSENIREIEVDDDKVSNDAKVNKIEEKFLNTLKKYPWITVRMDITNKCNLRCIMCHYREKEIYSKPTQNITASQLKEQLNDIAPFVKNIMLSCGFEPLMSKHFPDILNMLYHDFPHIEIGLCTNGMLLNSKARKVIIENNVNHVILSFDGVTKSTLERIRVGANYSTIISNIKALRDLKLKFKINYPLLFMDFVLMNSNINEAPAFVQMCAELGIDIIDFRHLVGNIYFNVHEEMLNNNKAKYNYYRQLIIDEAAKYNIKVRLPEPFDGEDIFKPEVISDVNLDEFKAVNADLETEEIVSAKDIIHNSGNDLDFVFLSGASCLRPFNEIMIIEQGKIMPCSYYSETMGILDDTNSLYSIFFNDNFKKVRRKKLLSRFDHNCLKCPIKLNLLPTQVVS